MGTDEEGVMATTIEIGQAKKRSSGKLRRSSQGWQPTPHPLLPIPDLKVGKEEWMRLAAKRERIIQKEQWDPLQHGWEPPIWRVCDALLGMPWVNEDAAEMIRLSLGFKEAVDVLMCFGGNSTGKSEYAGKLVQKVLNYEDAQKAWCFQSNNENSIDMQQPIIWKYMPPVYRPEKRQQVQYVVWRQKRGFTDGKFVLGNASECRFRNYEQEATKIEGGDPNVVWCDELAPPDWVETLAYRIGKVLGKMLVTFTPIQGWTMTAKLFLDGAQVVRWSPGYALPADQGEWDVERAVRTEEMSRPSEHEEELTRPGSISEKRQITIEGRRWELVPRVAKCFLPKQAIVWFHPGDNPFGNPRNIIGKTAKRDRATQRERIYGVANKTVSTKFPKFGDAHLVDLKDVPARGTNYLLVDPASGRNFFMIWVRRTPEDYYVYREWPGSYEIPEIGPPGPWAVPHGKKPDGKAGEGQRPFGFGLLQYKKEIARLERWRDWKEDGERRPDSLSLDTAGGEGRGGLLDWHEKNGAEEAIFERQMDSRFASSPNVERDMPITLIEEFEDLNVTFYPWKVEAIKQGTTLMGGEGVTLLNDLLAYDEDENLGFLNKPHLYVCKDCKNVIFALQNWTGQDGNKGACKDPIDCLRAMACGDLDYVEEEVREVRRGKKYY